MNKKQASDIPRSVRGTKLKGLAHPRRKLIVTDGEKRGMAAPFGATKAQEVDYQRKRDFRNAVHKMREVVKAFERDHPDPKFRRSMFALVEFPPALAKFIHELMATGAHPGWGDCPETVIINVITHVYRQSLLGEVGGAW